MTRWKINPPVVFSWYAADRPSQAAPLALACAETGWGICDEPALPQEAFPLLNHLLGAYPVFTLPPRKAGGEMREYLRYSPFPRSDQGEGGLVCSKVQELILWKRVWGVFFFPLVRQFLFSGVTSMWEQGTTSHQ